MITNRTAALHGPKAFVALLVLALSAVALAQTKPSTQVQIMADQVQGQQGEQFDLLGQVEIQRDDVHLSAPAIHYDQPQDAATVSGTSILRRQGNVIRSQQLHFELGSEQGKAEQADFFLSKKTLNGRAKDVLIQGRNDVYLNNAYLTSCRFDDPDWMLLARRLHLNFAEDYAYIWGARLRFFDTTIFALPYLAVPISDARHSGWLAPDFSYDLYNGIGLDLPYYFNIAPNLDATITPRLYGLRGAMLSGEGRYLQGNFSGLLNVDWLPHDRIVGGERYTLYWNHSGRLSDRLSYGFEEKRISDPNWWRDFLNVNPVFADRLLDSQAYLAYDHAYGRLSIDRTSYLVQQSDIDPIEVPYSRDWRLQNKLSFDWARGWNFSLPMEYTYFAHPTLVEGKRFVVEPKLTYSQNALAYTSLASVSLRSRYYERNGKRTALSTIPKAVIGGGLIFERDWLTARWGVLRQTLEPSLYYNYAPYRNQDSLPVFDSAVLPFSLSSLDTDNVFSGYDHVADANNVTLAASSRFYNPTGERVLASFTVGQRWHLTEQRVLLPGQAKQEALSNVLVAVSFNNSGTWRADMTTQYSPLNRDVVSYDWSVGYFTPELRTMKLERTYSLSDPKNQTSLSWQWPLSTRWYSAGKLAYSHLDHRYTSALLGFEYVSGCWVLRFGVDKQTVSATSSTKRYLMQLEFSGFSRVGIGPLTRMQSLIPNYRSVQPIPSSPEWVEQLPAPSVF